MINNIWRILMAVGGAFCFLGVMYMIYVEAAWQAVETIRSSGERVMTVAGVVALTEGEVISADEGRTIIRYYSEWDGAVYQKIIMHVNADYSENSKVPVVDFLGMAPGSCLVAGYYQKYVHVLMLTAFIIFVSGFIIKLKRKEIEIWQERKL